MEAEYIGAITTVIVSALGLYRYALVKRNERLSAQQIASNERVDQFTEFLVNQDSLNEKHRETQDKKFTQVLQDLLVYAEKNAEKDGILLVKQGQIEALSAKNEEISEALLTATKSLGAMDGLKEQVANLSTSSTHLQREISRISSLNQLLLNENSQLKHDKELDKQYKSELESKITELKGYIDKLEIRIKSLEDENLRLKGDIPNET